MGLNGIRFEELYCEYWSLVYAICLSRIGDEEEALDAARDVFIRKWRVIDTYDPAKASFRTWVRRNAENHCVDVFRKQAVRPLAVQLQDESEALKTDEWHDERVLTTQIVGECLMQLTPTERQLVLMHEVEGYTWEEIAAITGLTVAQSRVRTAQGITRLRELLEQIGMDDTHV